VRRYVDWARACGLDRDGDGGELTDELLAAVIAGVRSKRPDGKTLAWETVAPWSPVRPVSSHALIRGQAVDQSSHPVLGVPAFVSEHPVDAMSS
jgi:hypothetical protein